MDFSTYCSQNQCNEVEYEKYVRLNMSEFVQFYENSWKELFDAILNLQNDSNFNKFVSNSQLMELKIANHLNLLPENIADVALGNNNLTVLLYLKNLNHFVTESTISKLVQTSSFAKLKLLDTNFLFANPEFVYNEIIKYNKPNLLNGLPNLSSKYSLEIAETERKNVLKKYEKQLLEKLQQDDSYDDSGLNKFIKADPDPRKKNVEWIILSYLNGGISLFEDLLSQVYPALEEWIYLKNNKHILPDNKYNTLTNVCGVKGCKWNRRELVGLFEVLKPYEKTLENRKEKITVTAEDYEEILNTENIRVIIPKTEKGACYYGQGTKWCTAAKNDNRFDYYNKLGIIYTILPKNLHGEKYQIHVEENQVMNEKDEDCDIIKLFGIYPELKNVSNLNDYYNLIKIIASDNINDIIKNKETVENNKNLIKNVIKYSAIKILNYFLSLGYKLTMADQLYIVKLNNLDTSLLKFLHKNFPDQLPRITFTLPYVINSDSKNVFNFLNSLNISYIKYKNEFYTAVSTFKPEKINDLFKLYATLNPPIYPDSDMANYIAATGKINGLKNLASLTPPIYPTQIQINSIKLKEKLKEYIDILNFLASLNPPIYPILDSTNYMNTIRGVKNLLIPVIHLTQFQINSVKLKEKLKGYIDILNFLASLNPPILPE